MGYRVCQLILSITTYWIGEWQSQLGQAENSVIKNSIVINVCYKKKPCRNFRLDLGLIVLLLRYIRIIIKAYKKYKVCGRIYLS